MLTTYCFVDNIDDAYELVRDLEPSSPQEYILKAVANTVVGQERGTVSYSSCVCIELNKLYHCQCSQQENLRLAQQYFQLVGSSGSECGTLVKLIYL